MTEPRILPGCSVLPPMEPLRPRTASTNGKAEKPKRKKQTAERFGVINAFVDFTLGSLTRNETAVWLVLWRDTKDGTARTSQTDIARRAGIGRRTVVRIIDKLASKGLLRMVHRGGLRRGVSTYRVHPLSREPP
ncbi:MAG TPA: helix-turn-helix domain-containing protein [Planctomycetaceae bacterium]|nr:helix-turn-helix domain-containing protein [Planctomycetaceae bacterium]